MIDWVRCLIPLQHVPLNAGQVFSTDEDGQVEWITPKRKQAIGSFDKRISIKSDGGDGQGMATHLWISGNPSKFLQGHNVFGSDDLVSLVYDTFLVIVNQFNLTPTINEITQVKNGNYELKMVDINYSFDLSNRSDVRSFIRAMEFKASTRHGTRPTTKGGTLYFGKTSERWAIKAYCKADELQTKTGQIPIALQNLGIEQWAENKLRIELRLHPKEIVKKNILRASDLTPEKAHTLFNEYLGRINMTEQFRLTDEAINDLPNNLRTTYTLWTEGHDLRNLMSDRTFYRQKKQLMAYGINIDIQPNQSHSSNVVPMFRILEAVPASVPDWAFNKQLIHHSARQA